ncbi:MAG: DUF3078 domain-containing protein [Salinibacter sp.]
MFSSECLPVSIAKTVLILSFLGGLGAGPAGAQSEPSSEADTTEGFQYELSGKFSGTQAAYKDWQEGGLNTLSFTAGLNGTAEREEGRWAQTHELRLSFGLITSEGDDPDEPIRKADDQIRLESNFRYTGEDFFRRFKPTVSARLRTQFAKGFSYSENPFTGAHPNNPLAGDDPPVQTSAFFAPAYLVQTLGLTYAPKDGYTVRLSAAAKQTVVRDPKLRVLYDVNTSKVVRAEAGAELAATIDREIATNVRYKSSAIVFFSVNQLENPPDVLWENYLTLRVNRWLTTNLEFVALFDQNTSTAIQLKEVISVGVTFDLI